MNAGRGTMLSCKVRQRLSPALLEQLRSLTSSAAALQAVPATQDLTSKGSSFLSRLLGGGTPSRVSVPLTDPLPGTPEVTRVPPPTTQPQTESTTLPNGVKIVSEATYAGDSDMSGELKSESLCQGPTATVGFFVNSGSVYETPETTGASHLLEYMPYKSTNHRTQFRVVRELEGMGANVVASASREQMMYCVDVIRSNTAEAVEVLADTVLNPKFNPWEVNEAVEKLKGDLQKFKSHHQNILTEGLHTVGFKGALARPLVCPEEAVKNLNAEVLSRFFYDNFTAGSIVVAGAGIEHKELVSLAEPLLSGLPSSPNKAEPVSKYVGGDFRTFSVDPLTHTALAFEFPGGWRDVKGSVAVTVLQYLLGGGGSFSAGGPGKGMHSRLYRRVLNKYHWMHNCAAFNSLYNDTGLVGILASAESARATESLEVLVGELQALKKNVPEEELARAKNAAISQVLVNLESRAVVCEDVGRQVLTYGHRKPVKEFLDAINAVKPADMTKIVTKLLSSPVTHASFGDIADLPRYDELQKMFK